MSHNDSAIKTDAPPRLAVSRADFLAALYEKADPALWLEIRCIHPVSEQAHVRWTPISDRRRLAINLRQADILNKEGYGELFAPCLRRERKGTAEAAAMLPALWVDVDCDDDPARRSDALNRLHRFEPPPSIIIDSGGGWHAYWLLDEMHPLPDHAARQHIASILHGLFAEVGGDEDYARSVASLMRMPNTVNTKPGRGGVVATVIEFHPERRAPLSAFEWLATAPGKSNGKGTLQQAGNGHAPLPQVTLDYLSKGAQMGSRNRTLFDAACQFRDAGYSQAEAEAQLVARYVADGTGSENPAAREREARATIASAYHQAPRDPIGEREARQMVDQLVGQFGEREREEQPAPEQIAAAVKACAHLDEVEWAGQRQRLKRVCGSGVRLTDLDRLYRKARKALERERGQDNGENEAYVEVEGRMVLRREAGRVSVEKTVAAWVGHVVERVSQVNDDGQIEHVTTLELRSDQQTVTLPVPSELFGDDAALRRYIAGRAGEAFTVRAGMGKHLAPAILTLSGAYPHRTCYRFMGWTQIDERWTYVAPGVCVNAEGALTDPPEIELDARLRDYGLQEASWEDSLLAFASIIPVFPRQLAPACIAFALLPLFQRFFPAAAPRPAIHLAGTYGSGKSELAALMSSFYGAFSRDTPPAQWGDTINTVEAMGYPLANALYWVDDYKSIYADERTFTRFLQSYSRGMGRGRLTREARLRQERPCRGTLLSTGETVLEGEASVLSRMLVLDVPPWEHRDPGGNALEQADLMRPYLSGFTVRFAQWIAQQAEQGDLADQLADEFAVSVQGYRDKLKASGMAMANTGRVIQNWAVLVTVYRRLWQFLDAHDAADVLPGWQDVIVETAQSVRQERASEVFLNNLSQLLASGDVMLAKDTRNPEEPRPGTALVGYRDEHYIYLLPEVAYREVNRGQPLRFTVAAIGSQLREDGVLVPFTGDRHLAIQIKVRENRVRVWRLKADILSGDSAQNDVCIT